MSLKSLKISINDWKIDIIVKLYLYPIVFLYENLMDNILFSGQATFHICEKVHKPYRIWYKVTSKSDEWLLRMRP